MKTQSRWLRETLTWMRTLPRYQGDTPMQQTTRFTKMVEPPAAHTRRTPIEEVRAMVKAKRAEMLREAAQRQTDAEGEDVRRRIRNEIARHFEYLRRVPVTNGYTEALARQQGPEPEVDIYKDGPVPNGYSIALAKRGISPEVWEPTGDEPPDGYAIALAKRRKEA